MVAAVLGHVTANRDLHLRLQKKESHHIAQAVRQFAGPFFEFFFSDANSESREFARRVEHSNALGDLIDYDELSLAQLGGLFEALTLEYIMASEFAASPSAKLTGMYSTLPTRELESRVKTLRAAARHLIDDGHSGEFAVFLRDKKLASQLVQLVFNYSLVLKLTEQMQQKLSGQPRKRGRPQTPFGRFAGIAYQILEPLPDRMRLDLIAPFSGEFFGKKTNTRQLRDLVTQAGVRQTR
jgi:hypothetical protein